MAENQAAEMVTHGEPLAAAPYPLPRVTIKFCTQCRWMLRAAYFAQELLSTFSTALGEVALQPGTGGVFVVEIAVSFPSPSSITTTLGPDTDTPAAALPSADTPALPANSITINKVLWDRKLDGGFPETKELKRRVRDVIEPGRDLGHVDRDHHHHHGAPTPTTSAPAPAPASMVAPPQKPEDTDSNKRSLASEQGIHLRHPTEPLRVDPRTIIPRLGGIKAQVPITTSAPSSAAAAVQGRPGGAGGGEGEVVGDAHGQQQGPGQQQTCEDCA